MITKQEALPTDLGRRAARAQFGALCYRHGEEGLEVLLVTSKNTKRWVVPKGWPMAGKTPSEAAAIEAKEEAGAIGVIGQECLGIYSYSKRPPLGLGRSYTCVVSLFPLRVEEMQEGFAEKHRRHLMWFPVWEAAEKVEEPELKQIILGLPAALAKMGGPRYRHIKRGTSYLELGRGKLQTDMPLGDYSTIVAYQDMNDGGIWFRSPEELEDETRFEQVR